MVASKFASLRFRANRKHSMPRTLTLTGLALGRSGGASLLLLAGAAVKRPDKPAVRSGFTDSWGSVNPLKLKEGGRLLSVTVASRLPPVEALAEETSVPDAALSSWPVPPAA